MQPDPEPAEILLPRTGQSVYLAIGKDADGWWEQTEPDGPKRYGADIEERVRAVFPDWILQNLDAL